jgi:hypothetical protein
MLYKKWVLLLTVVFTGSCSPLKAEITREKPKPLIYMCEYQVKPHKAREFESVMKDFIREMKKHHMPYSFIMYSTTTFVYYSINEFENYGNLDRFDRDWRRVEKKIGYKTMDKYHKTEFGAINSFKIKLLKYKTDYSYVPEIPSLKREKNKFVLWTYFYIDPSKKSEWIEIQKKRIALYKNSKIKSSFLSYTGGIGDERPVWIIMRTGKNRIDYYRENEKIQAILSQNLKDLNKQRSPLIKHVQEISTYFRPDLSYFPDKD